MPSKEDIPQSKQSHRITSNPDNDPNHWSSALRCTICLEFFRDPRCLPCGHTFCKKCIEEIIDHVRRWQVDRARKSCLAFSCPHCRRQIPEMHYNKYSSKNVVVESIVEGWCGSLEQKKMATFKAEYGTQTELHTTDSWAQTEHSKHRKFQPEHEKFQTGSEPTDKRDVSEKVTQITPRKNSLESQLQGIGSVLKKNFLVNDKTTSSSSTCHQSVEEALYSLQDNLLPGDNLALGEYQLVTLPVSGPGGDSHKALIETINKMFC